MDPIIKWAGGKGRMLEHILPFVPDGYPIVEPFAGGAALTLHLERPGSILCDRCQPLMETYRTLRDHPQELIHALRMAERNHDERFYYAARDYFNGVRLEAWGNLGLSRNVAAERAALFIYLNKACFNGLWRVNKKGHFNVPWGKRKRLGIDYENLEAVHAFLQEVDLRCMSYSQVIGMLADYPAGFHKTFWYFDPPYFNTFSNHTRVGFDEHAHRDFAANLEELNARGVPWLLSHSDDPLYRELYSEAHYEIHEFEVRRSIAAKAGARGMAKELLIRPRLDKWKRLPPLPEVAS